jgi:hypothetical protein
MNLALKLDFRDVAASGTASQLTPHSGEAVVLPSFGSKQRGPGKQ